ncbi:MAG: response regulator transcription factor [Rhodothermales bacterium]|nr:response regulator transcription factor [Rhodothermales bacterium]
MRLLIVDDDPNVGLAMTNFFEQHGFDVTHAPDGETALRTLRERTDIDLVTLDVNMPGMDGFEVLRHTQEMGLAAPVLMVTARGEREDVLKGLGLGARDYVVKPFDPDDLLQRIEKLLGLTGTAQDVPPSVRIGSVEVDFTSNALLHDGEALAADEQEIEILRVLMRYRGEAVSRKRLLREAWGINPDHVSFSVSTDIIQREMEKHMEALRAKMEPNPRSPRYLHTVVGLGYRLELDDDDA